MNSHPTEAPPERFELLEELGRGAVGVVWRALDKTSGQEVALKLLLRQGDDVQARRFLREGELAASIRHPGICSLVASGLWKGRLFLAYELVGSAKTLHDIFPVARVRRRVELVRDAAEALGAAHALGVVHRDVKPANVLVDGAGQVRVTDFGAASGESLEDLTATGTLVGTPAYMAPEQMSGERDAIGPATDVWALGVMLYECLTETSPFTAETLVGFMRLVRSAEFAPVPRVAPDVHPEVAAICHRALSLSPEDRFPDAGAMGAALATYLNGGSAVRDPSYAAAKPAWAGYGALAIALALLAGLAWGTMRGESPPGTVESPPRSASESPWPKAEESLSAPALDLAALELQAERGDAAAALTLGHALLALGKPREEVEPWLRQAAQAGHPEAWETLGRIAMKEGDGREALQRWQRALEAGSTTAFARIGRAYNLGRGGVPRDRKEALAYFQRGAQAGDPSAQERLGFAYYRGRGVARDYVQARAWLGRAAQAGHPVAMRRLGLCEEFGHGRSRPDLAAARRWYRAAADAGDGLSLTNLGYLYETGKGVPVGHEAAVKLYREAAELGIGRAWFRLGVCAERGAGLPKSKAEAAAYFERGVEAGSGDAALRLGELVGEEDPQAARRWFLRGTKLGKSRAWFKLGLLHEKGRGGEKDLARAAACYAQGHRKGDLASTTALGVCYEWGHGVEEDLERAFALFTQAAKGGHPRGMAWLGILYRKGKGTARDPAAALTWFRRGAAAGDGKAQALLKEVLDERAAASPTPKLGASPSPSPR